MSGLRVLIVSSRYWPLVSEPERYLAELAVEFCRAGLNPTILSARWCPSWPALVTHQQMPVFRLSPPPCGGWATYRFLRELSRWVRRRHDQFDVVLVGSLRHEAYAVLGVEMPLPVVLTPQSYGSDGDCCWQGESRIGKRIRRRCRSACAIVVSNSSGKDELVASGYAEGRIFQVLPGVRESACRSAERQYRARQSLAAVNHDLQVSVFSPVVVCIERLLPERESCRSVAERPFVDHRRRTVQAGVL
jgi:hypothetical protein